MWGQVKEQGATAGNDVWGQVKEQGATAGNDVWGQVDEQGATAGNDVWGQVKEQGATAGNDVWGQVDEQGATAGNDVWGQVDEQGATAGNAIDGFSAWKIKATKECLSISTTCYQTLNIAADNDIYHSYGWDNNEPKCLDGLLCQLAVNNNTSVCMYRHLVNVQDIYIY